MAAQPTLELTGILATTDSFERLRLCLVESLLTAGADRKTATDSSWSRLRDAVGSGGPAGTYNIPYTLPLNGAPDDAGIRGECWITVPSNAQRARILAFATELRGKEVVLTVRPKRYSFASRAAHNRGEEVVGTSLLLCNIEAYVPAP